MFLMMEPVPTVTATRFWVLLTHSVPTLYLGLMKQSYRVSPDSANPRMSLAHSPPVRVLGEAHSPTPENSRVDMIMHIEEILYTSYFSWWVKPRMSKASSMICISSVSSMDSTLTLPMDMS